MEKITLADAVREYFQDYPEKAITPICDWHFFVKVMEKLGFPIDMNFSKELPTVDSVTRAFRKYWEGEEKKMREEGILNTGRKSSQNSFPLFHTKQDFCNHYLKYEKDGKETCGGCGKVLSVAEQ